ncbi:MAG: hypothetical protein IPK72_13380 [Candidatus Eisenbacteria bacterium]|nr:hypothetical protein [Candidatus Eisenbacteria bacterium]
MPDAKDTIARYVSQREDITQRVRQCLVDGLRLEIDPAQIGLDAPLFGSGLGLDSVDALGIVATLEVRFGLEIVDGDMALFRSVNTIVDFILAHQGVAQPSPPDFHPPAPAPHGAPTTAEQLNLAWRQGLVVLDLSQTRTLQFARSIEVSDLARCVAGNVRDMAVGDVLHTLILGDKGDVQEIIWLLRTEAGYRLLAEDFGDAAAFAATVANITRAGLSVTDDTDRHAQVAIVGPEAQDALSARLGPDILRLAYLQAQRMTYDGCDLLVSRHGDSGEFEYRILLPREQLPVLDRSLLAPLGVTAREADAQAASMLCALEMKSMRTSLLVPGVLPRLADLQWMLRAELQHNANTAPPESRPSRARRATAVVSETELCGGNELFLLGGPVGEIRRAGFSPSLSHWIGLAYVEEAWAWPGLIYELRSEGGARGYAGARSAPLFLTRTVTDNLNV